MRKKQTTAELRAKYPAAADSESLSLFFAFSEAHQSALTFLAWLRSLVIFKRRLAGRWAGNDRALARLFSAAWGSAAEQVFRAALDEPDRKKSMSLWRCALRLAATTAASLAEAGLRR